MTSLSEDYQEARKDWGVGPYKVQKHPEPKVVVTWMDSDGNERWQVWGDSWVARKHLRWLKSPINPHREAALWYRRQGSFFWPGLVIGSALTLLVQWLA